MVNCEVSECWLRDQMKIRYFVLVMCVCAGEYLMLDCADMKFSLIFFNGKNVAARRARKQFVKIDGDVIV